MIGTPVLLPGSRRAGLPCARVGQGSQARALPPSLCAAALKPDRFTRNGTVYVTLGRSARLVHPQSAWTGSDQSFIRWAARYLYENCSIVLVQRSSHLKQSQILRGLGTHTRSGAWFFPLRTSSIETIPTDLERPEISVQRCVLLVPRRTHNSPAGASSAARSRGACSRAPPPLRLHTTMHTGWRSLHAARPLLGSRHEQRVHAYRGQSRQGVQRYRSTAVRLRGEVCVHGDCGWRACRLHASLPCLGRHRARAPPRMPFLSACVRGGRRGNSSA